MSFSTSPRPIVEWSYYEVWLIYGPTTKLIWRCDYSYFNKERLNKLSILVVTLSPSYIYYYDQVIPKRSRIELSGYWNRLLNFYVSIKMNSFTLDMLSLVNWLPVDRWYITFLNLLRRTHCCWYGHSICAATNSRNVLRCYVLFYLYKAKRVTDSLTAVMRHFPTCLTSIDLKLEYKLLMSDLPINFQNWTFPVIIICMLNFSNLLLCLKTKHRFGW